MGKEIKKGTGELNSSVASNLLDKESAEIVKTGAELQIAVESFVASVDSILADWDDFN